MNCFSQADQLFQCLDEILMREGDRADKYQESSGSAARSGWGGGRAS